MLLPPVIFRIINQYKFWQDLVIFGKSDGKCWESNVPIRSNSFIKAHYILLACPSLCLSDSHVHTQISDESPSSHHHSGTQKNLFHTHTYTNTHLHSAAVCTQIQRPCAREEKNMQYQQHSRWNKQNIPAKTWNVDFTVRATTK